jgi:hypothetical protein
MPDRAASAGDPRSRADELEELRLFDLADLRGAEFLRLLRFAHNEGLLAGLIRDTVFQGRPRDIQYRLLEEINPPTAPENRAIESPSKGQHYPRIASGLSSPKSWFRLVSSQTPSCGANLVIPEVEITPDMVSAGEDAILGVVGGADLGGSFSAPDLAAKVYEAMELHRIGAPNKSLA